MLFKGCKYANGIPTILPMQLLGGIEVKKTHVEVENMLVSFLVAEFGTLFELQKDPRKGPHLPSFPTLLRLGGLFGVFFGFYSLSI